MKYEYIIDERGCYYVPRPNSVCEGQKRHVVFKEKLGVEPSIISPTAWKLLSSRLDINVLED